MHVSVTKQLMAPTRASETQSYLALHHHAIPAHVQTLERSHEFPQSADRTPLLYHPKTKVSVQRGLITNTGATSTYQFSNRSPRRLPWPHNPASESRVRPSTSGPYALFDLLVCVRGLFEVRRSREMLARARFCKRSFTPLGMLNRTMSTTAQDQIYFGPFEVTRQASFDPFPPHL